MGSHKKTSVGGIIRGTFANIGRVIAALIMVGIITGCIVASVMTVYILRYINSDEVISLDDRIENMIMSSVKKMDTGSYLALEPTAIQSIVASATAEINKIKDLVNVPIVLTSPVVRIYFKKLIDQFYPNVAVVSFSEIDNNIQIQALGNISLSQR